MSSLLIGYRDDPHVTSVASAAARCGRRCVVFDPHSLVDLVSVKVGRGQPPSATLHCGNLDSIGAIESVWFRFKPLVELPHWGPMETSASQFAQGEWRTTLRALESIFPDARWINSPTAQRAAASKITQLRWAQECGFRVPDTLISNDPREVEQFVASYPKAVYKTLEWAGFPDQTGVYTTEINVDMVKSNAAPIRRAPGIFQEFVQKDYELRVTVVGSNLFTVKINSPAAGKGAIDWRHNIFDNDMYEPGTLDATTQDGIHRFQRMSGLIYGAYDLVRAKTGEIYFLECNPAGQYLWLEEHTGVPITDAIAQLL
jgi:glutathione synthase/RimK-type ligase-like ATP-grasp enzyme